MATTTRRRRSSYNLLPPWVTWKKGVALVLVLAGGLGSLWGTRLVLGIAKITGENPLQVVSGIVGGGSGSSVDSNASAGHRINIAMYGYGGPGHDGPYLSDSIMIVSIQPQTGGKPPLVAEISIPRDWYVPYAIPGKRAAGRINGAYAAGEDGEGTESGSARDSGASVANPTLENLLGISVDHWVGVDFDAFKQAVDAVGGVDVNVPDSFTDYQYPAAECNDATGVGCAVETVHFNAGWQHMDGARALIFSRSRHSYDNGEGSDFARSRRQQLVVAALKSKVVSIGGISNLPDLLSALGDHVVTDLTTSDMESLYGLVKGVDPATVLHVSLDDTNFLYECGYPANCGAAYIYAHDRSYKEVAHYIQNVFVDPQVASAQAQITFEDASGRGSGASGRWAKLLGYMGLKTQDGGVAHRSATTQVIDASGGRDTATAQWLASYFGVNVTTPTATPHPSGSAAATATPSAGSGGVIVVLGQDEEQAFNADPGVGSAGH